MKHLSKQPFRATFLGLSIGSLMLLPLLAAGCERTESSTKTKTEKVVETPEGPKKITETTETK